MVLPDRVLAIGAHPDDWELLCGGTLARYAAAGVQLTVAAVTHGDKGHRSESPERLRERRLGEAEAAAALLPAAFVSLAVPDGEVFRSLELRTALVQLIRETDPGLVITHAPEDYHVDHAVTSELVTEATWFAASPGHRTAAPPLARPVPLVYMDTVAGLSFQPTEYVDITAVISRKQELLRCHASQMTSSAGHGDSDLEGLMMDMARFRGHQCGVGYAEAFRPCLKWKRVRPHRLLP